MNNDLDELKVKIYQDLLEIGIKFPKWMSAKHLEADFLFSLIPKDFSASAETTSSYFIPFNYHVGNNKYHNFNYQSVSFSNIDKRQINFSLVFRNKDFSYKGEPNHFISNNTGLDYTIKTTHHYKHQYLLGSIASLFRTMIDMSNEWLIYFNIKIQEQYTDPI